MKEFIKLIERYESLTIDEIAFAANGHYFDNGTLNSEYVAKKLTGFGSPSCVLCVSAMKLAKIKKFTKGKKREQREATCNHCVYFDVFGCMKGRENEESYNAILDAITPNDLLFAYRQRAELMRNKYL